MMRHYGLSFAIASGMIAFQLLQFRAQAADGALPNIVIIFIDDMGYADIGPFEAEDLSR